MMSSRKFHPIWLVVFIIPLLSVAAALLVFVLTEDRAPVNPVRIGPTPTIDHPLVGEMAPNFELAALDGGTVRLSSLRGRVVFVNFWATWCEPCRREFPAFEAFNNQQDEAVILAVNEGEPPEQIQSFLDEIDVGSVQVLLDNDFGVGDTYKSEYFPATFVINPAGIVSAFHLGEVTLDDLARYVADFA
ncbi:MAG: alkyl hydroperoxide reductase [Anaerolineaceae bacterium]|nr:alkyl hydroperoxide reductase [Anaerolineaceae bacterium]